MEVDIPIIITRKGKHNDFPFRQASPQLLQQLKQKRYPSLPKPRNTNPNPKHQTLDPDMQITASRTRRISSSAAAKRFPKDFFKDENCLNPIKSIRAKHKQCDPTFLDTFSHKNFLIPQKQQQPIKDESDTPKFHHKDQVNDTGKRASRERLRSKVEQLISQTPISKYHTASEVQNKHPLLQIFDHQKQSQPFGPIPFISNFNVTLGQKVAFSLLSTKGLKSKRKKGEQKENNECESGGRENNLKAEGFRIRRKMQG